MTRTLTKSLAWPLLAVLLAACGGKEASPPAQRAVRSEDPAYALYQRLICHRCHGNQLEGGPKAPPLSDLREHFDATRLRLYLLDPDSVQAADPRLHAIDQRYTSFEMPSYASVDSTSLAQLIEFLLAPWQNEAD